MNNEIITREGNGLQAERLVIIENRIRDNMNRVAESALDIGRCLNQAKEEKLVPHGEWQAWVTKHTGMSARTAQNVMKAAREIPATSTLSALEFSKVQTLLALPPEERESFAEEVGADEMSVRELKEAVAAKQAAEREAEAEAKRRIEVEKKLKALESDAQSERDGLLLQMDGLREELLKAQAGGKAQEEINGLRDEIEDLEAEVERRARAEADAKRELLSLRSQVARGFINTGNGDGLTPDELGEATRAFIGRAAVLPHMRSHLAGCDHKTRAAYRAQVEMVLDWCERSMRALETVDGEVIDCE